MSGVERFGAILSGLFGVHLLGYGWSLLQVTGVLSVPVLITAVAILVKWKASHPSRVEVICTEVHQEA